MTTAGPHAPASEGHLAFPPFCNVCVIHLFWLMDGEQTSSSPNPPVVVHSYVPQAVPPVIHQRAKPPSLPRVLGAQGLTPVCLVPPALGSTSQAGWIQLLVLKSLGNKKSVWAPLCPWLTLRPDLISSKSAKLIKGLKATGSVDWYLAQALPDTPPHLQAYLRPRQ